MKNGFVITSIKKSGVREMTFTNNHFSTYTDETEAQQHLKDVIENNTPEILEELCGTDLQVTPVLLYDGGDSTKTVFDAGKFEQAYKTALTGNALKEQNRIKKFGYGV